MPTRDDLIAHRMAAVEDALRDVPPIARERLLARLAEDLTVEPPAPPRPPRPGVRPGRARGLDERIGTVLGFRTGTDYLYALRPALWLLRALVAGMGLFLLLGAAMNAPDEAWPTVLALGGLAGLALLVPSVRIGRAGRPLAEHLGTLAAAVILALALFATG
ncbi:hypothetical protein Afil01_19220 [Actinorhabdospora filicis]|uniref:Uncharacterized protein n=1 Tax=Actinorhabdospora filicis TaxID=1785913 RepID=A0A9W6SJJ0_9ACTN|nr:hypothetical protein [Actinorhabdospora filicis]GLZ77115.1 hypothetical protein Afil01_19220 [Actinorhabdospora filicis]